TCSRRCCTSRDPVREGREGMSPGRAPTPGPALRRKKLRASNAVGFTPFRAGRHPASTASPSEQNQLFEVHLGLSEIASPRPDCTPTTSVSYHPTAAVSGGFELAAYPACRLSRAGRSDDGATRHPYQFNCTSAVLAPTPRYLVVIASAVEENMRQMAAS